ncbi:Retrovirus-related Pol polyprotein from transposon 17.6 [Stylophora pistillata]|uniref:Retrovirus-related Pol polyprotein from transposon 17.6 n=1 Tax=Stylophora pistillata TaxID=50429 RepID=A0A2B4R6B8_STYPI|nr:Retrovirus-related Pol polyprotein from transposon 17.6 [Stylophora pistillata]
MSPLTGDKKQHGKALKGVLDRIRDSGLKLYEKKCRTGVTETTFLGHMITAEGIKPDPKKIEAITDTPTPSNKTEVQHFLGMITYLDKFLPHLSDETAPLRQLLEKDVEWHFEEHHHHAVQWLKNLVTSTPILTYYDPNLPLRITADPFKSGLEAVLEQGHQDTWKPVAFASRAMTQSEQNYAQIEKEILAIVFACECFHEYSYGRAVTVRSDHKPLKAIFTKPLSKAPPRLQRLLLRIQRYDLHVQYTPGTDIPVADALSRAYLTKVIKLHQLS